MLESIVGAGGVLVPPTGYMEGVRALCDKYNILLILDEVTIRGLFGTLLKQAMQTPPKLQNSCF